MRSFTLFDQAFLSSLPPSDPYFSSVVLLLNGQGANGSTSIIDQSPSPKTVTAVGNAKISTAQFVAGSSSIELDGTGDWLTVPTGTDLQMGAGNFTWETWLYPRTLSKAFNTLWAQRDGNSNFGGPLVVITSAGTLLYFISSANASFWAISGVSSGLSVTVNQWQHIALVRNGNTLTLYKEGTAGTPVTLLEAVGTQGTVTSIGSGFNGTGQELDAYYGPLRITKGVSRYTANFTPSPGLFPTS